MATVFVVSIEWNDPPSEVTGDTGVVAVRATQTSAEAVAMDERRKLEDEGRAVYDYSQVAGRYCAACGFDTYECAADHECNEPDDEAQNFCDHCGAETNSRESCDNDHDAWDVDVHVSEHEVQP